MIAIAVLGCFYLWRGTLFKTSAGCCGCWCSPCWPADRQSSSAGSRPKSGRQPWIVYGLMRTPEGLSAVVKANVVLASLILFTFIYFLLFAVFIYLLNDKIQHGPDAEDLTPPANWRCPTTNIPPHEPDRVSISTRSGSSSSACSSPATRCSTALTWASARCICSPRRTPNGGCCSTPSARSGTATKSGWSRAAARCSPRFRTSMPRCSPAFTWRSCCCWPR